MTLTPLWQSGPVTIIHTLAALLAIILGATQLLMPKGTPLHRAIGRTWVGIMALVGLSSFGIHHFRMLGPFSVIHLLSVFVLLSLWQGIHQARKGNIAAHKQTMILLYVLGLILTGAFTLFPGRILHRVLTGG